MSLLSTKSNVQTCQAGKSELMEGATKYFERESKKVIPCVRSQQLGLLEQIRLSHNIVTHFAICEHIETTPAKALRRYNNMTLGQKTIAASNVEATLNWRDDHFLTY